MALTSAFSFSRSGSGLKTSGLRLGRRSGDVVTANCPSFFEEEGDSLDVPQETAAPR